MRLKTLDLALMGIGSAVVAAFLVPNIHEALQRKRQRHTLADMRTIATSLEVRAEDTKSFAIGPTTTELRRVPWSAVERALMPVYATKLPRRDGWGNPFGVYVNDKHYLVRSVGSDGRAEGSRYRIGDTTRYEDDLVFADGNFIRAPGGI